MPAEIEEMQVADYQQVATLWEAVGFGPTLGRTNSGSSAPWRAIHSARWYGERRARSLAP